MVTIFTRAHGEFLVKSLGGGFVAPAWYRRARVFTPSMTDFQVQLPPCVSAPERCP